MRARQVVCSHLRILYILLNFERKLYINANRVRHACGMRGMDPVNSTIVNAASSKLIRIFCVGSKNLTITGKENKKNATFSEARASSSRLSVASFCELHRAYYTIFLL